jgi:hypothetical protein
MNSPKENAPAGTRATNTTNYTRKYKRFPPYGKKLMSLRLSGEAPTHVIMVVFSWYIGRVYPRIVIDGDTPIDSLEFSYLSGIPVQIVYCSQEANRVDAVAQEILKVNPSFLSTFNLDLVDAGKATTIIKPLKNTLTLVTP